MKTRLPILPTLIVLIAAAIMIRLGVWQLARLHEKETMLAQYGAAEADRSVHPWAGGEPLPVPYSHVATTCAKVNGVAAQAGENTQGQPGWAQVASCTLAAGSPARVVLGWTPDPQVVRWGGGPVTGIYVDRGKAGALVYTDPPQAGLQPIARPDPRELPNNHLAYAVQWFAFAGVALVIYGIAVRKRIQG